MKNRNLDHKDDWMTPPFFYNKLNEEFNFNFDPCPYQHNLTEWDGLLIEWGTRTYINPPYSRKLKDAFVKKAIEESEKGKLCVMLLPVSTSTQLFHDYILPRKTEIRFVRRRLPFIGFNSKLQKVNFHLLEDTTNENILYDGKYIPLYVKNSGMHDSMIVIFNGLNN